MSNEQPFTKPDEKVTVQQLSDHIDFIIDKVQAMSNKTWAPRQSDSIIISRELHCLRRNINRLVESMLRSFTYTAKTISQRPDQQTYPPCLPKDRPAPPDQP